MKNLLIALAYIGSFFGSLAASLESLNLLVQTEYGLIPVANFGPDSLMTGQQFAETLFATFTVTFLFLAYFVLRTLDQRKA